MEDINDVQNLNVAGEGKQYIVVRLENEQYGIDIKYVDNIVRQQKITRIPSAQHYFKGVINLRGEVIPVMSLRLKFGLIYECNKNYYYKTGRSVGNRYYCGRGKRGSYPVSRPDREAEHIR